MATTTCSRDHEFCAVYKKEPPGNSSLHQYTRYCASECRRFNTTYTIGRYQKTKHCLLCCDGDLCNNYLIDPCNPKSKVGRVEYGALIIVLITVIALYTWTPKVDSWLDGLAFPQFTLGKMLPTTFLSNRPYSRYSESLYALKDCGDKSNVMWFLRGANKWRNLPMQEVVVEFANYRQQKMKNFW